MPRLPEGPDKTPTHIWNPLIEDFKTTCANDDNVVIPYVIKSQEISTLPAYVANKIKKNLASYITLKRGVKTNYEDDYKATMEEISVIL